MNDNINKVVSFEEDNFDLQEYKNATNAVIHEKSRIKSTRRKISFGKVIIAATALAVSVLLYYLASVLFTMM